MSFNMTLNVTDEQFESAKKSIRENGGGVSACEFWVKGVEGDFERDGDTMYIEITDKPWLASEGMIKEEIHKFFR